MSYKHNPKLAGSGIIGCIPQCSRCPHNCADCFFQEGRSYLEPHNKNLPNIPEYRDFIGRIIRMNDGHDSNIERTLVMDTANKFKHAFYNTASIKDLAGFDRPVVVTINPGKNTDTSFRKIKDPPPNLMFVRMRTNTWNLELVDKAVDFYTSKEVPVVLTFMAYFTTWIQKGYEKDYIFRKRTRNEDRAITTKAWRRVMRRYEDNILVSSCGKIEGEKGSTRCRYCGVCLREYFATLERMRPGSK